MEIAVIDFETYYDNEFSLSKMSTEDYVSDPRFEVVLVAVKIGNAPTLSFSGTHKQIGAWFDAIGLWDHCLVAHNMMFDGLILHHVFGRLPARMFCTLFMAQATLRHRSRRLSLHHCLDLVQAPYTKGDTVQHMKGRTRASLNAAELATYTSYCVNDVESTMHLVKKLARELPADEYTVMDLTLRMYLEPTFRLDAGVLSKTLNEARAKRERLFAAMPAYATPEILRSNPRFAALLQQKGVDVPMKTSPITGKTTWALAKTDPGWKDLEDLYASDPEIGPLLAARVGAKSSIEESRCQRLLDIALRHGHLRVPLMYHAAHPGRYGGMMGLNLQNLPRIDKSTMRFGIRARREQVVLAADLAQIEARITALLAGQLDLLAAFAEGRDVYSEFASRIYGRRVVNDSTPDNKKARFVGKTCILGLGYSMGSERLRETLRKDGFVLNPAVCQRMVHLYRDTYPSINYLWKFCDALIRNVIARPVESGLVVHKFQHMPTVFAMPQTIHLPNGMRLRYPKARYEASDAIDGFVYTFADETRTLHGGKVTENVVQALARAVIMHHMVRIYREVGLRPALQQHDELDYVVPASKADEYAEAINAIMIVPPDYLANLPLAVEINYGPTLGDCK